MNARRTHTIEAEKAGTVEDAGADITADAPGTPSRVLRPTGTSITAGRLSGPHTRAEAEEQYVAARNAWTAAMRAASSGRAADLASLAITQEAYEAAAAERDRWISGERVAIPVQPDTTQRGVDAAVGQELAWRRVRASEPKAPGLLGRLGRRLRGR